MAGILDVGLKIKYENQLTPLGLSSKEEEWLSEVAKHHSYFKLELYSDNKIRNAYLMDASNAKPLSKEDRENYEFEGRRTDEGVIQRKINLRKFKKLWDRHLIVSLNTHESIEYVNNVKYDKLYLCRPLGWVIDSIQADNYGS